MAGFSEIGGRLPANYAATVFGIYMLVSPQTTVLALLILFGAYALLDGALNAALSIRMALDRKRWWPHFVQGTIGLAIAAVSIIWPPVATLAVVYMVAFWALSTGVLEFVAASRPYANVRTESLHALNGFVALAFGILIIAFPGVGVSAVALWLSVYAILSGVVLLGLSFHSRRVLRQTTNAAAASV